MSDVIEREIDLRCGAQAAFDAFTARLDLWWPPSHRHFDDGVLRLESGVGGRFVERAADGREYVFGDVVTWDPPNGLSYSWNPGGDAGPTQVDVRFVALDAHTTRVEVRHTIGRSNAATWPQRMTRFAAGWDAVLPNLDRLVVE